AGSNLMLGRLVHAGLPLLMLAAACGGRPDAPSDAGSVSNGDRLMQDDRATSSSEVAVAMFGGGCFWCMEPGYESLEGVLEVTAGYAGGEGPDPTYDDYASKGHTEVVQVTYDPSRVDYDALLDIYWRQIDPTDAGGQFADRGPGYRPVIFYHTEE